MIFCRSSRERGAEAWRIRTVRRASPSSLEWSSACWSLIQRILDSAIEVKWVRATKAYARFHLFAAPPISWNIALHLLNAAVARGGLSVPGARQASSPCMEAHKAARKGRKLAGSQGFECAWQTFGCSFGAPLATATA